MSERRDPLEQIDDLLSREPYLDDGGFTDRVLACLPASRRGLRPLVLGLSAAVAAGLGVAFLPDLARLVLGWLVAAPALLGLPPALAMAGLAALGAGALGLGVAAWTE